MRREFQFVGGGSSKFWAIELAGTSFTVQFGRIGTAGQTQVKEFGSDVEARKVCGQLIAEKTRKGYVEMGAGEQTAAPTPTATAPPTASATVPPTASATAPHTASATAPPTASATAPTTASATAPTTASATAPPTASATAPPTASVTAPPTATAAAAPAATVATASSQTAAPGATRSSSETAPQVASNAQLATTPGSTDGTVLRTIALEERDWHWATWRDRKPVKRPETQAFDFEDCLRRLGRVTVAHYGWKWDWSKAKLDPAMGRAEACFWLTAMSQASKNHKPADRARALTKSPPLTDPSFEDVCTLFGKAREFAVREVVLVLARVLSSEELLSLLLDTDLVFSKTGNNTAHWDLQTVVNDGLHEYVLPYLENADLEKIRRHVEPLLDVTSWPTDFYARPSPLFHLAAMVGASEPLLPLVRSWKDDLYRDSSWDHTHYHQPQIIVLGLGDAGLVESEMRRLKLPLNRPAYLRGWLANTEYAGLDYARDCVLAVTNREECEALAQVFALVQAPEAAPHMLELKLSSRAPKVARQWMEDHRTRAVAGLVDTAGGRGRLADAALDFLRDVKCQGHEALIRMALGDTGNERVRREVLDRQERTYTPYDTSSTPAWLAEALAAKKRKPARTLPWLHPETLPPLVVDASCLNPAQVNAVLAELQAGSTEGPPPLMKALRAHADGDAMDTFAWRLFELWMGEGAPSKEKWAMAAVGFLGGDRSALRITPLIRAWPGESQHQRAVAGLDCLRAIGTDTALMCLNGIAQKLPFKALKARAAECMDAIAAQRGMTRAELEDRIVPDCDLDERGSRVFDFGPRQFRFVLGAEMKPMVKDAEGRLKTDLPAPNSKDDAAKATAAVEEWKLLKKQVREVARIQAERLEQAMVTGRRWTVPEFQTLLVRHPLMVNLVRLVVWGGYSDEGRLVTTFRVTEDQEIADERDAALAMDGVSRVGVVHPLHLSDEQKRAWGEVFTDYEIIPPFAQLGRPLFSLEAGEAEQKELVRFRGREIPATALVGTLERLAWARGVPEDAGIFHEHTKPFPGANVTAIVNYEGIPVGYMEGWEDQEIESCLFIPGLYTPTMYPDHREAVPLGSVDPVVISEVLKDLTLLASKGK